MPGGRWRFPSFIRDASHEFRNPLAIINAQLYLLDKRQPDPENSERTRVIQDQVTYIAALVDALLEMSKLDSATSFTRAPVDVNDLLRDLAGAFDAQARRQGLRLKVDLAPNLPLVRGDGERLHQALFHIIRNAIEYSEGGGTVALISQRSPVGILLVVQDEGAGIAPEDLPHIFERFFQGDRARTPHGVGLGLPIASKIIEAHGGQIGVTSVLGQGTTFRIELPAG
jgi:signal transduction histidine kinase